MNTSRNSGLVGLFLAALLAGCGGEVCVEAADGTCIEDPAQIGSAEYRSTAIEEYNQCLTHCMTELRICVRSALRKSCGWNFENCENGCFEMFDKTPCDPNVGPCPSWR